MTTIPSVNIYSKITRYQQNTPIASAIQPITEQPTELHLPDSDWTITHHAATDGSRTQGSLTFTLTKGAMPCASVSLGLSFTEWDKQNYVLMPAAVYNGNRFRAVNQSYPPALTERDGIGLVMPVTETDVPRLAIDGGSSQIQLKAADMATPAVAVFDPVNKRGYCLLFKHQTALGYNGVRLVENDDRAELLITAPAVREKVCYTMCNTQSPSPDRGHDFVEGEEVTLPYILDCFPCADIQGLYDHFFTMRKLCEQEGSYSNFLPYSQAMRLLIEKHNRENWSEEGFYRVGTEDAFYQEFQSGWVGGGMNIYALYLFGGAFARARVHQTMHFILTTMQAPTGFFYGIYYHGKLYGDLFGRTEWKGCVLLRKNADMLVFLLKTYQAMCEQEPQKASAYQAPLQKACDAFVTLWNKYGQWGQFIDADTGEIFVGQTASAGAGVAALALASRLFDNAVYLDIAKKAAAHYLAHFTAIGLTNGGPGEIAQTPDSESAFALLESYTTLYEVTGEQVWLQASQDAAKQCATWCVSYNFNFPPTAEFAKRGIKTVGSVYANAQNKHSAPAICTFSGDSLLKLYRATGNPLFLDLLTDIAHQIPQYISRDDLPIHTPDGRVLPSGYINERVNMCDWEGQEMVGGVFYGSCWCECAAMLSFAELPGVYAVKDTGVLRAFDNVIAAWVDGKVMLTNPTAFDAQVLFCMEESKDFAATSLQALLARGSVIAVAAGQTVAVEC